MENKRQVQTLVSKSKNIVCLKPRNPEEKSSSPVIVKALCDYKQDHVSTLKRTHVLRIGIFSVVLHRKCHATVCSVVKTAYYIENCFSKIWM